MNFLSLLGQSFRDLVLPDPCVEETIGETAYVTLPVNGVSLILDQDGMVTVVQLYGPRCEEVAVYQGELPAGLRFEFSREQARTALGQPLRSGSDITLPDLGHMPPWDRWIVNDLPIHVEYDFDTSSIRLVTLGG